MKTYAMLNENKICIGISQLSGEVIQGNMIEISDFNSEFIWKKYENGTWSAEKFEPASTAPIDEFVQLKAENEQTKQALAELTMYISTMNGGI